MTVAGASAAVVAVPLAVKGLTGLDGDDCFVGLGANCLGNAASVAIAGEGNRQESCKPELDTGNHDERVWLEREKRSERLMWDELFVLRGHQHLLIFLAFALRMGLLLKPALPSAYTVPHMVRQMSLRLWMFSSSLAYCSQAERRYGRCALIKVHSAVAT